MHDSDSKWAGEIDQARQALSDAQSQEPNRATAIREDNSKLSDLERQISEIETKRINLARKDQVQRIAGRVFGLKPEEVGADKASLISLLWFGSLAALAALAGPITAIVALGLQRIGLESARQEAPSPLSRLIRSILITWRWRRTKTVTITKEVPVEKIVKEILYIPILTDDPDTVMKSIDEGVPPDVSDLVKVSIKGRERGNKAQHKGA